MLSALFFFFNDTATTEIYTLSLHDALPIWGDAEVPAFIKEFVSWGAGPRASQYLILGAKARAADRKSTRLNSSHLVISYAVFCLKKKKKNKTNDRVAANHHVDAVGQKQVIS